MILLHPPTSTTPLLLLSFISVAIANLDISTDCGSLHTSPNAEKWVPDVSAKSSSLLRIGGSSSSTSTPIHSSINSNQPPYGTARISHSEFSYSFVVNPGKKILRLHFNPVLYKGFKGSVDLFTVELGDFTLLRNFSASVTAQALGLKYIVKEFCLYLQEYQHLYITFSPTTSSSFSTYAFINGIEIVSMPSSLSFFHGRDIGVQVVGQQSKVYVAYNTALELVHRFDVRQSNNPSDVPFDQMLLTRATQEAHDDHDSTQKIPVDTGFRYLIRLHFSMMGLKTIVSDHLMFEVVIDEVVVHTNVDIGKGRDENNSLRHMDYIISVMSWKKLIKRDLVITLHSYNALVNVDGNGLLSGFEVFKLSNLDGSLATPNPLPLRPVKPSQGIKALFLSVFGFRYGTVNVLIVLLSLVNVIGHKSSMVGEGNSTDKEVNRSTDKVQPPCRRFSLSEIQSATRNFTDELLIGRGGFGLVYRGTIDNGATTVAVKRLKLYSSQGTHEFLTEIELLSKLQHHNLVSLIGYCAEHGDMILVYDYMSGGTLSDHLYKLPRERNVSCSLTWKQRLKICIGAARGLDYLHTGNAVIHRDVKAANILLDENFVARVSDFGLAKREDSSKFESHVSTRVKGTKGYLDPHYMTTCKLTRKSDTYAFGVVLLEVLFERPALDLSLPEEEQILSKWALENINQGNIYQTVPFSLRDEVSEDNLNAVVAIAKRCLHDEPKKRPTMTEVVFQLEAVLKHLDGEHVLSLYEATDVSDGSNDEPSIEAEIQVDHSPSVMEEKNTRVDSAELLMTREYMRTGKLKPFWPRIWNPFRSWNRQYKDNRCDQCKDNQCEQCKDNQQLLSEIGKANSELIEFHWMTIVDSTNNFSPKTKLGTGKFGPVFYKAVLPTGLVCAVKRFSSDSLQEFNEDFAKEILLLTKLYHPNIIRVLGYCIHGQERAIVYKCRVNTNLDFQIESRLLDWALRLKIIMGIARGAVYLHEASIITHSHLNPENILLDGDMNPIISNVSAPYEAYITTAREINYLSPEYVLWGKFSVKSDVYTFGAVVLEIITGKRSARLTDIAWKLWKEGRALGLIGESAVGPYPLKEAERFIQVAMLCIQALPSDRPTMSLALKMLEGVEPLILVQHEPLASFEVSTQSDRDSEATFGTVDSLAR